MRDTPDAEIVATASTVVYANSWMTVREDVTRHRSGLEGIYGVVDKPDFALVWQTVAGGSFKDAPSLAALALFARHRGR